MKAKKDELERLADQIGRNEVVFEAGRALGRAEGERRERRALRRWLDAGLKRKLEGDDRVIHLEEFLSRDKLSTRATPAKRKSRK